MSRTRRRSHGGAHARPHGDDRARGRPDLAECALRGARGDRPLPLLRRPGARRIRRAAGPARADRRAQHAGAARARRLCSASRRGIFRSPSSSARSRPRSPPAMPSSPSRPKRRRSSPRRRCDCCTKPACPATRSPCFPATGRASARAWSPIRASPALPSPARPRRRRASRWRSREGGGPIVPFIAETGGQNALIADSRRLARAIGGGCRDLGLRQRRTALLGAARALRPGCRRRPRARHARGRDARTGRSAIPRSSPPISAR